MRKNIIEANGSVSATLPVNDCPLSTIDSMKKIIDCLMVDITKKHGILNSGLLGDHDPLYIINNIYNLNESLEELKNRINSN